MFRFLKPSTSPDFESAPPDIQRDIDTIRFGSIYEAVELAKNMNYAFISTVKGRRWKVFPDGRSPVFTGDVSDM